MEKFAKLLKANAAIVSAIFGTIGTIGGAVLYVENNFASAKDVQEITQTQQQQLKIQSTQQKQFFIFQLEYYDNKISKLQEEKRIAEERVKQRSFNRAIQKSPDEIQEDITDTKQRRELVRKSLSE